MTFIDTHCHLDDAEFDADREAVWQRARAAGVNTLVIPGVTVANWGAIRDLCAAHEGLLPAYGLHPMYLDEHWEEGVATLETWLGEQPAVAVGEIGLDFLVTDQNHSRQLNAFTAQLDLAQRFELPVLIHARKAHDRVLWALRRHPVSRGGIVHAFNGSPQQAKHYLDMGFYFGVGGAVTFDRAQHLRRLIAELPLEALVLETDAPDIPLADTGKERNEPDRLPHIAQVVAELRGLSVEAVATATSANTARLLRLL